MTTSHTERAERAERIAPPIPIARRTLAEIVTAMLDAIDEAGGEVTAAVDELELELQDKVQAYRAVMLQLQGEQKAFKQLADDYRAKADAREAQVTGLKFRLDAALKAMNVDKMRTPTCTVYYQSTKRVELRDEVGFVEFADDAYVVTKRYANRDAIKEALDKGEAVDGAELVESKHLRFR